ncbi:mitochondrial tRNA-specific 2-thiouridylase 1 isoform X1 [Rhipicephalus microplus]|uniref:mitochondrial tRNA-specific 2-thiouridylase 1 isoform X1 n=1 Tax=Rhipicephalus microplus TaxID=6941 RepID=UPI003F6D67B5
MPGDTMPTLRCLFRTQHRNSLAWCIAIFNGEATGAAKLTGGLKVILDDHYRAIAIGQFIVLYSQDGECYGSTKILGLRPKHYEEQKQAAKSCPPHRASAAGS